MKTTINLYKLENVDSELLETAILAISREMSMRALKIQEIALDTNNDERLKYANARYKFW